jgi:predicted Rossmann-fold nucleotide-binding protein
VIAFDYDGFFEPLKTLLEHYISAGMMDTGTLELLHLPRTAEEVAALLK